MSIATTTEPTAGRHTTSRPATSPPMPRSGYPNAPPPTAEQSTGKLRDAEVGLGQGKTVPEVVRLFGVTEQNTCLQERGHGGLGTDQAKRLMHRETENTNPK